VQGRADSGCKILLTYMVENNFGHTQGALTIVRSVHFRVLLVATNGLGSTYDFSSISASFAPNKPSFESEHYDVIVCP